MHGAAQALFGCVSLPLECGRALMAVPDASSGEDAELAAAVLDSQAELLSLLMESTGCARAAQLVPPEPLLSWLSAAASRVGVVGTLLSRGRNGGHWCVVAEILHTRWLCCMC
jgi:hypothetical protein